jgi:hypothetical protein
VANLKFTEEQPQILRLRKPQKTRLAALRMTSHLLNELQAQDNSDQRLEVGNYCRLRRW